MLWCAVVIAVALDRCFGVQLAQRWAVALDRCFDVQLT